jgi:hypothetical protein
VDQKAGEICVNGLANYLDTSATLNRRVEFFFSATGDIEKQGRARWTACSASSASRSTSTPGRPPLPRHLRPPRPCACEFDAKLGKIGEDDDGNPTGNIKADMVCDLSGFIAGVLGQKGGDTIIDSIAFALDKKKSIRFRVQTGDFRINHNGFRVDPVADGLDFSRLTACTAPPPPPPE